MAQNNWEADKMLDVYIHDYLMKRNLQATAKTFMSEGKVSTEPVAIDAPGGFLFEWWSVFWDIFISRTNDKHSQAAATYIQVQAAQQMKSREQQIQQQSQLVQQRQTQLQRRDGTSNNPSTNGTLNPVNSETLLGPSPASLLAAKMYGEHMKHHQPMDSEASSQLLDPNRIALLNSATNRQGQLGQNSASSLPTTLQHMQGRNQLISEMKNETGLPQRSLPLDPLSGQSILQAKSGLGGIGLGQGANGLPLKGWPLTGIDQLRPGLGPQLQKPILPNQSQFQLLSQSQQQQILTQAQVQSSFGNLPIQGDMDARRFKASSRSALTGKDGQLNGNDGSIGSPMQSSSPQVPQIHQLSNQQGQEQVHHQQSQQNSRKRKPTSSGAANSTGTGHTVGPVNSPPSTHTPGDGLQLTGNLQGVSTSKNIMMYGTDTIGGLGSSSIQMDDIDQFADVGPLDDNVESFLSNDNGDGRDIFVELKRSPTEHNAESMRGFSFAEIGCNRASNNKVVSCHFSSDGKLLASAGHERKVVLWNVETKQTESSSQSHTLMITDVRFRPNSTQLVTSSFDRTVRLWDAADSIKFLHAFNGHTSQVKSVDFHPIKTDIFSSCDGNGEICYWSTNQSSCSRVSKGGSVQVRFQPTGQFLAAAAEKMVSVIDFETNTAIRSLQVLPKGYNKELLSICWDATGERIASASQDCVKIWSLKSGERTQELKSNGNQFHSCIFHPRYPQLLVIGGYQSLELWNIAENRTMTVQAHEGLIAALAQSPLTGMIASASHDKSVKIWK